MSKESGANPPNPSPGERPLTSKPVLGSRAIQRKRAFESILRATLTGRTCDEVERDTGMPHQTASARVHELMKAERIRDTGRKRQTQHGGMAIVWVAVATDDGPLPGPSYSSRKK